LKQESNQAALPTTVRLRLRWLEVADVGGNFARSVMFNHQPMKTLASSLLLLAIASFATAAESVTLKDIAGDYYFGDGLGVNCSLTLTAKGKFTFQWNGCLGTYDKNEGTASIKEGVLHIAPQKPNLRDGFRGTPTEFYPVRWGARLYLIPTNDIVEFCSDFNQGSEPRPGNHGSYYLRRGDADKAVSGKPAVPAQWTKFFLEQPVRGKITELVGRQGAWLDKGSADGLLEGMILTAQQHGDLMFAQVRVEAVENASQTSYGANNRASFNDPAGGYSGSGAFDYVRWATHRRSER